MLVGSSMMRHLVPHDSPKQIRQVEGVLLVLTRQPDRAKEVWLTRRVKDVVGDAAIGERLVFQGYAFADLLNQFGQFVHDAPTSCCESFKSAMHITSSSAFAR